MRHPLIPSLLLQRSSVGGSQIDTLGSALDPSTQDTVHPCTPKVATAYNLPPVKPNLSPPTHSEIPGDVTDRPPSFMDYSNDIEATIEGLKHDVATRDKQILEKEALLAKVCPIKNYILFAY